MTHRDPIDTFLDELERRHGEHGRDLRCFVDACRAMGVTCDRKDANVMLYVPTPAGSGLEEISFLGINEPDGKLWVSNFSERLGTKQDPRYDTKWGLDDRIPEGFQAAMSHIDDRLEATGHLSTTKFVPLDTITPRQMLRMLDVVRRLISEAHAALAEKQKQTPPPVRDA